MSRCLLFLLFIKSFATAGIATKGRVFRVNEGETVELPCYVQNIDSDGVVMWKRGENDEGVLFTDEESITDDPRFHLHTENNNFTLIIERVEPYDTAQYVCEITSPAASIKHYVQVNVRPSVSISPDSNPLLVNVGENVIMKCSGSGNPTPTFSWTKQNGKLPSRAVSKDGQLRIMNVGSEDSGIYECTASNNVGADAKDTIEVRVQSGLHGSHEPTAPWVDSEYSYVPVEIDQHINISCKYNAEPPPQVDWLFNTFIINFSDDKFKGTVQYGTRIGNHSESLLSIDHVTKEHFGDYSCRVSNNIGTAHKTIHVSGRPGPPELNVSGSVLSWHVRSKIQLNEYRIRYRLSHEDMWQQPDILIWPSKEDKLSEGDLWYHSEDMRNHLKPGNEYDLQVEARNGLGWGSLARSHATMQLPAVAEIDRKSSSVSRTSVSVGVLSAFALTLTLTL